MDPQAPPPLDTWPATRLEEGRARATQENLAVETPFELRLNGRSHTMLMVSPLMLEELALGLCLSEGLVDEAGQVLGVDLGAGDLEGLGPVLWADVRLPPELARRAKVRRVAPAATSCGLCGLESLKQMGACPPPLTGAGPQVALEDIFGLCRAMEARQELFRASGGCHAVGLGDAQGRLLGLAEDVGRHNALDKVIGLALGQGWDLGQCVAMLSGRLSYEMALKSARAGIPVVASVSAPTSLGLALMQRQNLTLVGFLRPPRATVYTHPQRVLVNGQPLAQAGEKAV